MNIAEAIRHIAKTGGPNIALGIIAKVTEVNGTTCTVSPIDDSADIENVRLQAGAGNGVLIIPKVDSVVIVHMVNEVEGYVSLFSEVESIQFHDGTFGGLVKVIDLVAKLNNLENKVNDLITYINGHSHASNGTPPSPPFGGGNLTPTVRANIENTKVTHGNI